LDDTVERGTRVLSILRDLEEGREPPVDEPADSLPTPTPAHTADPLLVDSRDERDGRIERVRRERRDATSGWAAARRRRGPKR
jgi:hypothetical protein